MINTVKKVSTSLERLQLVQSSLIPKKVTRDELNSLVDRAADLIRTAVDYKFILVLLFLKRLNDIWKVEKVEVKNRLMKESGWTEAEANKEAERKDYHSVDIPKQFLWDEVTKDVNNLPQNLATGIGETAKLNSQLQGVINRVDFLEFARNQENRELLRQLVELFDKYNLGGEEVSPDVLGDAYEHILMKFAPDKAKEGEIYTPREVIKLMVEILDPKPSESVYDPCCGSGGMLIISYLHVAEKYGVEETRRLFLFGQERSPEIYAVGQMNLLLHEIKNANLANGDTLDYPRFRENGNLKQFDVVIANIPWNQDGYGEERLKKAEFRDRFQFGYPPKHKGADWAWVQHMLSSASEKSRIGVVVDTGCLFKGGKHKVIRRKIVESDFLECIILTPKKLFYNTGSAGAILVFNKSKPSNRKNKILFINASDEFKPHPSVRRLNSLSKENIERIVETFQSSTENELSKLVDIAEIAENDYRLNVALYAMQTETRRSFDILEEFSGFRDIDKQLQTVEDRMVPCIAEFVQKLQSRSPIEKSAIDKTESATSYPEEWITVKLGDYASIKGRIGWRGLKASEYTKEGPFLIANKHIINQKVAWNLCDHLSEFRFDESPEIQLKTNDVIMSKDGTIGEAAFLDHLPDRATINSTMMLLRVTNDKLFPKFLYYYTQGLGFRRFILQKTSGTSIPHLFQGDMKMLKLPLPSVSEQNAIIEVLSIVDREIELLRSKIERAERLKTSLVDLLLSGKVRVGVK